MVSRIAEDDKTIQILIVEKETYQFVFDKASDSVVVVYSVRRDNGKTIYNPLPLDEVSESVMVRAVSKIRIYQRNKQ